MIKLIRTTGPRANYEPGHPMHYTYLTRPGTAAKRDDKYVKQVLAEYEKKMKEKSND